MNCVDEYNEIMSRYRSGEFGMENLPLQEILDKAGNPRLLEKMTVSELQHLRDVSSGLTKQMFSMLCRKRSMGG